MKWKFGMSALTLMGLSMSPQLAGAADHRDGTATTADPTSDINDVFTWTSADGQSLNLVMSVFPAATAAAAFSTSVQYVFHTASFAKYSVPPVPAGAAAQYNIICTFQGTTPGSQTLKCWAGTDDYATGAVENKTGVNGVNNKMRVYAGLRDDAFFFNLQGFKDTALAVHGLAAGLTLDAAGCPALTAAQKGVVATGLKTTSGGAPVDFFKGLNALTIVVQVNKSLVTKNGPIVSVWGSTNKGQ